jgi:hypothetical protein
MTPLEPGDPDRRSEPRSSIADRLFGIILSRPLYSLFLPIFLSGLVILSFSFMGGGLLSRAELDRIEAERLRIESMRPTAEPIACPLLGDFAPREECLRLYSIFLQLRTGTGGLVAPEEMTRGDSARVSFAISRRPAERSLPDLLGEQPTDQFSLRIGRRMAARLEGEGFSIRPAGQPDADGLVHQDIFVGDGARWAWDITAQKATRHRLILSVYVVIESRDGARQGTLLKSISREIPVRVTWSQWTNDLTAEIVAILDAWKGVLIAATALLAALIAFRKRLAQLFRKKSPKS